MDGDKQKSFFYGDFPEWVGVFVGVVAALLGAWAAYQQWIAHHEFTPELQKQYEAKLRKDYQSDLKLDPSELKELSAFAKEHQLREDSVETTKKELMTRIEAASRSIDRGLDLARKKHFADARQEFLSATQSDPGNSAAWADLGAADVELGQVEEGRSAYDKALVLAPEDWRTHFNFGLFYARAKNPDAALEQFQQVFLSNKQGTGPSGRMLKLILRDAETEPALGTLRKDPRFQDLLKAAKHER